MLLLNLYDELVENKSLEFYHNKDECTVEYMENQFFVQDNNDINTRYAAI